MVRSFTPSGPEDDPRTTGTPPVGHIEDPDGFPDLYNNPDDDPVNLGAAPTLHGSPTPRGGTPLNALNNSSSKETFSTKAWNFAKRNWLAIAGGVIATGIGAGIILSLVFNKENQKPTELPTPTPLRDKTPEPQKTPTPLAQALGALDTTPLPTSTLVITPNPTFTTAPSATPEPTGTPVSSDTPTPKAATAEVAPAQDNGGDNLLSTMDQPNAPVVGELNDNDGIMDNTKLYEWLGEFLAPNPDESGRLNPKKIWAINENESIQLIILDGNYDNSGNVDKSVVVYAIGKNGLEPKVELKNEGGVYVLNPRQIEAQLEKAGETGLYNYGRFIIVLEYDSQGNITGAEIFFVSENQRPAVEPGNEPAPDGENPETPEQDAPVDSPPEDTPVDSPPEDESPVDSPPEPIGLN